MRIEHHCEICGRPLPSLTEAREVTLDFKHGDEVCYSKTYYVCKNCDSFWDGDFLTREATNHIRTEQEYGL